MNKKEFIEQMEKKARLSKKDAQAALKVILDLIITTTKKKQKVTFTGFGTFEAQYRKARMGRNPRTGATIHIPASKAPRFRAGKGLKEAIQPTPVAPSAPPPTDW